MLDTLGWIQHLLDRNDQALASLQESTRLRATPANHYHLGRVLAAQGRNEEARDALERAVELAEANRDTEMRDKARVALNQLAQPASRNE